MKKHTRRIFIKTAAAAALGYTSNTTAVEKPVMVINYLVDVLRSTNKPVCNAEAEKLLLKNNHSDYDLHLRNANLSIDEIILISKAIKTVHDENGPSLKSFSMSYNQNIKDEGVFSLVNTLPSTLTEIGLVQCGISDKGADALLAWAPSAPQLHWLCVEDNALSNNTKSRFIKYGKRTRGLLVVV